MAARPDRRSHRRRVPRPIRPRLSLPPSARGPFETAEASYELDDLEIASLPRPVEVVGQVVGPVGASGDLPLVVLLHGYNASCWNPVRRVLDDRLALHRGVRADPELEGFTYLQERLASQGFLTVSLSAHGVNVMASNLGFGAGAAERAALVSHHLDAWASGDVPGMEAWPDVDMDSVLLVGHSRGGEGIDQAVADRPSSARWSVAGEVLIAPTAFLPAERGFAPVVTLTGYCDGDVGPGAQQRFVDRPADAAMLRSSIILDGANHNFFNSEWVPGESTGARRVRRRLPRGRRDRLEVPAELADQAHRRRAAGRRGAGPRVGGRGVPAPRPGRPATSSTDGRPSPWRRGWMPAWPPWAAVARPSCTTRATPASAQGPMSVEECVGISETEDPGDCGAFTGEGVSVHWPEVTRDPVRLTYLDLEWEEPGGSARLDLKAPLDLSQAAGFEARVAVAPVGPPVQFDVTLTDAGGRSATLPAADALSPYPEGDLTPSRRWGQRVFVAVGDDLGIDLSRVVAVTFTPTTSPGRGWIIDISALPAEPPA